MKRLFATTLIVVTLLATSQVHASAWNWSFDQVAGTFITNTIGSPFQSGTYTLTDFNVEQVGTSGLVIGSISDGTWSENIAFTPSTFFWDNTTRSATQLRRNTLFTGWVFEAINNGESELIVFRNGSEADYRREGGFTVGNLSITPVPVPAAAWLFTTGLLGLAIKGCKARACQ